MISDYSEKEFAMIKSLSPHWAKLIESDKTSSVMPPQLLSIVALQCFIDNSSGPAVESLRRCVRACQNCKPYRMTKEYDDLIQL
jgi:hypothetical protein